MFSVTGRRITVLYVTNVVQTRSKRQLKFWIWKRDATRRESGKLYEPSVSGTEDKEKGPREKGSKKKD